MTTPTTYIKVNGYLVSSEDQSFGKIKYRSNITDMEESGSTYGVWDTTYTASTSGTLISVNDLGVQSLHVIFSNLDADNRVKVQFTSGNACSIWVDEGDWILVPNVSHADTGHKITLTAENADVDVRIIYIGIAGADGAW